MKKWVQKTLNYHINQKKKKKKKKKIILKKFKKKKKKSFKLYVNKKNFTMSLIIFGWKYIKTKKGFMFVV